VADPAVFAARGTTQEVEEGRVLAPKFDADGLLTCVATDMRTGDVLMVAHMNAEALQRTLGVDPLYRESVMSHVSPPDWQQRRALSSIE
jgi:hypothetical protein